MVRLPSRVGPGVLYYAVLVFLTEAARGPATHAHRRRNAEAGAPRGRSRGLLADRSMAQAEGQRSAASPGSPTLLNALLQNLYDFGETKGETEQKRIRKNRNKKIGVGPSMPLATEPAPSPGFLLRGQRKSASSFFQGLREELHCVPAGTPTGLLNGPEVPATTVSSSSLKNNREQIEVVEFHSSKKKGKLKPDQEESIKTKASISKKDMYVQEFNLEKARLEVHRFGITGYGKGKERVLEQERAIMLGAKPPKSSYVNYKVLQEQIKEKKAAKEEEKRMAHEIDIFKKKKRKGQEDWKPKKKKSAPSILSSGPTGQVGKFRNGTLILSPFDIKKINSSRVAK
ncbi:uncharacterized protein C1orf131 homolog [Otolemur garnettii]|uniref:uncharacterized protein C1orf131 homolog n=1 Tax=Otolemur garnettii TaxID=30611 RepID=UPI000C7E9A1F|nr:uncharacterized protein C1orf131 homolog [Otolemur garnettii]